MRFQFGKQQETHPMQQGRNRALDGKKPAGSMKPQFRAALQSDGTLELMVYGDIVDAYTVSMLESWGYSTDGMISALSVKKAIEEAGSAYSKIAVRINSPGGDAFEGIAIHSLLTSQGKPVEVCVDGIAASSASIIAMAGGKRTMGPSSMLMIHNAWCGCVGNAAELRKMAGTLDKIDESIAQAYVGRTGKKLDEVIALMNDETWLSAQDCIEHGFATDILEQPEDQQVEAMAMARSFKALSKFSNRPPALRNEAKTKRVDGEDLTWNDFIVALDHEDISTWHLPYKFSTVEKTKAHLRDALARFDQVEGLTKEQKHAAWKKLVSLCKKYGIEVSAEDHSRFQIWSGTQTVVGADDMEACQCSCEACQDGDCANCSNAECEDPNCVNCPMQAESGNSSDLSLYEARFAALRLGIGIQN